MFALAYYSPGKKRGEGAAICWPQFFDTIEHAYQALGSLGFHFATVIEISREAKEFFCKS